MDDKEIYTIIGLRIRLLRMLKHMSQKELAEAIGITLYMLKRYEAGKSHIYASTLDNIAKELRVTFGYFFEGTE